MVLFISIVLDSTGFKLELFLHLSSKPKVVIASVYSNAPKTLQCLNLLKVDDPGTVGSVVVKDYFLIRQSLAKKQKANSLIMLANCLPLYLMVVQRLNDKACHVGPSEVNTEEM